MNLFTESKKQYLFVMVVELVVLSCIYWMFFNFKFSSLMVYILAVSFYITMYRIWLKIFDRKEYMLFPPIERYSVLSTIYLFFVLSVNAYKPTEYTKMFCVYVILFFIFICYYIFKKKKEKKSPVPEIKFSTIMEIITAMCGIFLIFDWVAFYFGKLSLQLVLYLPFLFLILSFIICIYKKYFSFNSFSSLILFLNIYIVSTLLLVVNYINCNSFSFIAISHFIIFSAVVFVMLANSVDKNNEEFQYNREKMGLILLNIAVIFIALNNILFIQLPDVFISYLYFVSILFVSYLGYKNYKML